MRFRIKQLSSVKFRLIFEVRIKNGRNFRNTNSEKKREKSEIELKIKMNKSYIVTHFINPNYFYLLNPHMKNDDLKKQVEDR